MIDDEILELQSLWGVATAGEWVISYDPNKNPCIRTPDGRMIVDSDVYAEDIKLIVRMRRAVPKLLEAYALLQYRMHEVLNAHERDAARISDVTERLVRAQEATTSNMERDLSEARTELAELRERVAHAVRTEHRAAAAQSLAQAVREFARYRYFPRLEKALEAFEQEVK